MDIDKTHTDARTSTQKKKKDTALYKVIVVK